MFEVEEAEKFYQELAKTLQIKSIHTLIFNDFNKTICTAVDSILKNMVSELEMSPEAPKLYRSLTTWVVIEGYRKQAFH